MNKKAKREAQIQRHREFIEWLGNKTWLLNIEIREVFPLWTTPAGKCLTDLGWSKHFITRTRLDGTYDLCNVYGLASPLMTSDEIKQRVLSFRKKLHCKSADKLDPFALIAEKNGWENWINQACRRMVEINRTYKYGKEQKAA